MESIIHYRIWCVENIRDRAEWVVGGYCQKAGLVRNGERSRAPEHSPNIILGALLSRTLAIKIARLVLMFKLQH